MIPLDRPDHRGQTAVHHAAIQDDANALAVMLEFGALSCVRDDYGYTPAHYARSAIVVDVLALYKADLDAEASFATSLGETPMSLAIVRGKLSVVGALIAHGASVSKPGLYLVPPLHLAVLHGETDIVERLLARGADARQAVEPRKQTPLHVVADRGVEADVAERIIRLLLDAGADPSARTFDGETAWDALRRCQPEAVKRLEAAMPHRRV